MKLTARGGGEGAGRGKGLGWKQRGYSVCRMVAVGSGRCGEQSVQSKSASARRGKWMATTPCLLRLEDSSLRRLVSGLTSGTRVISLPSSKPHLLWCKSALQWVAILKPWLVPFALHAGSWAESSARTASCQCALYLLSFVSLTAFACETGICLAFLPTILSPSCSLEKNVRSSAAQVLQFQDL